MSQINVDTVRNGADTGPADVGQIGVGQTYQAGTYTWNTTYTNNTSRPIMVSAWIQNGGSTNAYAVLIAFVDGAEIGRGQDHCPAPGFYIYAYANVTFIVPPGLTWRLDRSSGAQNDWTAGYIRVLQA